MNYEIRPMRPEDGEKVLEIFKQGIDGGNATFDTDVPVWEAWDTDHFNISRFVLEDENNEVVGWCALMPVSKRECFKGVAEVSIYLDNSFQGKGLGQMLLRKLITDSEDKGFWTLQVGIFPENEASIAVHQKLGFRTVGTREKIGKMSDVWRDIVFMERRSNAVEFG